MSLGEEVLMLVLVAKRMLSELNTIGARSIDLAVLRLWDIYKHTQRIFHRSILANGQHLHPRLSGQMYDLVRRRILVYSYRATHRQCPVPGGNKARVLQTHCEHD